MLRWRLPRLCLIIVTLVVVVAAAVVVVVVPVLLVVVVVVVNLLSISRFSAPCLQGTLIWNVTNRLRYVPPVDNAPLGPFQPTSTVVMDLLDAAYAAYTARWEVWGRDPGPTPAACRRPTPTPRRGDVSSVRVRDPPPPSCPPGPLSYQGSMATGHT